MFLSSADAYDRAPNTLKEQLKSVSILASFHAHNDPILETDPDSFIPLTGQEREALPPVWHKVLQRHPASLAARYFAIKGARVIDLLFYVTPVIGAS